MLHFFISQADTVTAVIFYITYALVLVQFAFLFVSDVKALGGATRPKALSEEEAPLLGDKNHVNHADGSGNFKVNASVQDLFLTVCST